MAGGHESSAEQRGFEALGHVSESGAKPLRPLIDRLFSRGVTATHLERDWASDADWARLQQAPLRARAFLYITVLALIALLVWASVAPIDEVTRGAGRVVPSSQLQRVQSFDGGVVQAILVNEGQLVEAGQVLMRIDPTRFVSTFRENRVQALSLQARIERLRALVSDTPFNAEAALIREAPQIVAQERELYQSQRQELEQQKAVLEDRIQQRREELREAQSRRDTAQRETRMVGEELNLTRPLLQTGAVSEVEILRLERELSRANGERNQADAAVSRLESAVDEVLAQLEKLGSERRSEWRNALTQALGELSALDEASTGLQDRIRLSEVRSPVNGVVQTLHINTLGGVARQGQDVVDIIPSEDRLVVEARIAPQDIAFLHPGQPATIKLTAYDFAIYGGLEAQLERISADTVTDEEGNTFYRVRVKTREGVLEDGRTAANISVIPGMTAQVDIMTGKRTVMQFILKPVLRAWDNALGER